MAYIGRDIQYGVLDKQSFTTNSSTTVFTLDSGVKDAKSLLVSVGGVIQEPDVAYTASGTTLTFSTAPATGMVAYAIYLGKTLESGGRDQITFQNETGDGTTTPFTLSATPANAQSIMVTLNGVTQVPNTDYTVSGTVITFTVAPVNGMGILVYHLGSAAAIGTINDASVTDAKIVGMSASKISGSLGANTVANTSIVSLDASKLTGTLPNSLAVDTTALDQTIAALGLHVAVADNKVSFNLPDAFLDQFEDSTGVDSTNSVNALVSSDEYVTSTSELDTATNIAPSSNDWDYTFAQSEWPVAGNPLGDHTSGGYVDNTGGDSAIFSLHTFSGDFKITWTATGINNATFGVCAIDEDDTRATLQRGGLASMTNSYWFNDGDTTWRYGNSTKLTAAIVAGSLMEIERVAGVVTFRDDGADTLVFVDTYSGPMRMMIGAAGSPFDQNFDDLKFTVPSTNVQYDGFFNEGSGTAFNIGNGSAGAHGGVTIPMTVTGNVTSVKTLIDAVGTAFNSHMEVWSSNGTSPLAQIGTDSASQNLSTTGEKTFTFSTPVPVVKGVFYWFVVVDEDLGTGSAEFNIYASPPTGWLSGRNNTISSITDFGAQTYQFEVAITPTGEPTPDHNTLALIHSDTTNGSTTFTSSDQNARTITVVDGTQHSTAQQKLGATSILFDGSNDSLTLAHSDDFQMESCTVEAWVKTSTVSKGIISKCTWLSPATRQFFLVIDASGKAIFSVSNGSSVTSVASTTTVTDNAWHHIAGVKHSNTGKMQIFVDGVSEAESATSVAMHNLSCVIDIGDTQDEPSGFFNGYIDEVRISNVARWDANFTPPTAAYPTATATTLSATGTLISTASTASSATTSASGVMLYSDASGTATLGTDLEVYFSADDGANWTEASSYGTPITFSGTTKMVKLGKTTGLTSGTQMKLKAEWANQSAGPALSGTKFNVTAGMLSGSNLSSFVASEIVDGSKTEPGSQGRGFFVSSGTTNGVMTLDLGNGNAQTLGKISVWCAIATSAAVWAIQYSDNNSSWTNTTLTNFAPGASAFSQSGGQGDFIGTWDSVGAHRYWRMTMVSGNGGSQGWVGDEIEWYAFESTGAAKETRLHGWALNY